MPRRRRLSVATRGSAACSTTPRVWAMVGSTRAGSLRGARSTKKTPSGNASSTAAATWRAKRVLPVPPGPVSVSKWVCGSCRRSRTAATSRSRPMKGVRCTGRLWRGTSSTGAAPGGRGGGHRGRAAASSRACSAGAYAMAVSGAVPRLRAASKTARSSGDSRKASPNICTVSLRGTDLIPRSRSLMPRALSPARSASSSWVRPAARRWWRSRSPKARAGTVSMARLRPGGQGCSPCCQVPTAHGAIIARGRTGQPAAMVWVIAWAVV